MFKTPVKSSIVLKKILKIINNLQPYSLKFLGKKLEISTLYIFNIINKLKMYGISINVTSNYLQIKESLILLDENKIMNKSYFKNYKVKTYESISSTNDYFFFSKLNKSLPYFCFAEFQELGRGSLGRFWESDYGKNITFSFSYFLNRNIESISSLSLVISISIIESLNILYKIRHLKLKWPNDVYLNEAKISGNIINIKNKDNDSCEVIIGIGLNVNMDVKSDIKINQRWASLKQKLKKDLDRNILIDILINIILKNLYLFNNKGFSGFIRFWNKFDFLRGKYICILQFSKIFFGYSVGVNQKGHLCIKDLTGKINNYSSGNIILIKN